MPTTIRFPYPANTAKAANEADQIIEIFAAAATLPVGGAANYVDVSAWKHAGLADEVPYTDIVIEFTASADVILGNGTTERIALFGEIVSSAVPANRRKFLLGVLGINLGNAAPQVPISSRADAELVGFAQVVCNVGAYDRLSIGGVDTNVISPDPDITVRARPIRKRSYMG